MIIQRQTWADYTRYLLADDWASVQLELFASEQKFGGTAFIYGLWVNQPQRRQGKAAAFLKRAESIAREAGHKSVTLEWYAKDTPQGVLDFYIRSGYEEKAFDSRGKYVLLQKQL